MVAQPGLRRAFLLLAVTALLSACGGTSPNQPLPPFAGSGEPLPPDEPAATTPATTPAATAPSTPATTATPTGFGYPSTTRQDIVDTLHGTKVADPYRWLENVKDPKVQAWMTAQNKVARAQLAKLPGRAAIAARLRQLYYYDSVSAPAHRGNRYFYSRRHAKKEKAVYYWKEGETGTERVLLDPNTMSADGSVSVGGIFPSKDGTLCAYRLKKNNADTASLYIMDVASGKTRDAEVIGGARYAYPSWTPDNKGFFYTRLPTDKKVATADMPGEAHVVYHRIGTDPKTDALYHAKTGNPKTFIAAEVSEDGRWLFVTIQHGWNATDVYYKDLRRERRAQRRRARRKGRKPIDTAAGYKPLAVGIKARFSVQAWKNKFYIMTNHRAPNGRLYTVSARRPLRRKWREIVRESKAVLKGAEVIGGRLVLRYLRDAHSELEIRSLRGRLVRKVSLPGIGSASGMVGRADEDDAYFSYQSFTEPRTIFRTSIKRGKTAVWARVKFPVDTSKFTVDQVKYPSKDGTRVSMFIIRRKDAKRTGDNPVVLHGYGGFNVSMTPFFSTAIAVWLEHGGIWAIPNLRGGGEYGEKWHKAGMLLSKQNVFDDFEYAARYLIKEKWTTSARLAIRGGSNGGLLVGAAMTQHPELYKAVICAVPLLDMVRYHKFGSGKTWIPEYGSADDAKQFAAIYAYSPYHHVSKKNYPAMLMLSADTDDRVDPMHARKFTAAMQWATDGKVPMLLRIEKHAGHGGADMVKQKVQQTADTYAFLMKQLGMK